MDEALEVICAVNDLPPDDPYVASEMESIRQVIALEQHEGSQSWTAVFKKDVLQTRNRVFLAWFGLFMNQLSGINLGESAMIAIAENSCANPCHPVVYYLPSALSQFIGLGRTNTLLIAGFIQL